VYSHQDISSALLARFDHRPSQFLDFLTARLDNSSISLQWSEICNTQLGKFFDQEVPSIAFGERSSNMDGKGKIFWK